jgi:hypothetical protein
VSGIYLALVLEPCTRKGQNLGGLGTFFVIVLGVFLVVWEIVLALGLAVFGRDLEAGAFFGAAFFTAAAFALASFALVAGALIAFFVATGLAGCFFVAGAFPFFAAGFWPSFFFGGWIVLGFKAAALAASVYKVTLGI